MASESNTRIIAADAPIGVAPSPDYKVTANGQEVFVQTARVSSLMVSEWWPGHQRPIEESELASFATFDADGPVSLKVTYLHDVFFANIRPSSRRIEPRIETPRRNIGIVTFQVDGPGHYTCEINGARKALHLFVNPIEKARPEKDSPHTRYFGPGVHRPGKIELKDNETLYVDDGAHVHAIIEAKEAKNIKILGRGIIDASTFERTAPPGLEPDHPEALFPRGPYHTHLQGCQNIEIDGVIIKDSPFWTLVMTRCSDIRIRNLKIIGNWRYNSDGIDLVNCRDVHISDCFIRAFDDNIVIKGREETSDYPTDLEPVENVTVENCVLWCDWGRSLKLGTESLCRHMRNVSFSNCDIVHFTHAALAIVNNDIAQIKDVSFRDIRIEEPLDPLFAPQLIELRNYKRDALTKTFIKFYKRNQSYQRETLVEDIRFEDIRYHGRTRLRLSFIGENEANRIENVVLANVSLNRAPLERIAQEPGLIETNEYVSGLRIENDETPQNDPQESAGHQAADSDEIYF